ncbi:MAG: PD-(D/E)XK nuclease domain-containing protein [Lachnospiraceae bacterium]|nr:PD-(D/E)XK nuclease domain-containing protein [Lachnospiraceae bacterium]
MELKWKKGLDEEALEKLSEEALAQIDDKEYDFEMREDGVENISKFGIAFSGKKVVIKTTDEIDSDAFVVIEPRH